MESSSTKGRPSDVASFLPTVVFPEPGTPTNETRRICPGRPPPSPI
jgi:hypothetical protein